MKFKKNFLKVSILACVLVCVLVAGSIFAFGNEAASDKLNIVVGVPSASVKTGDTFTATVKISNTDISSFKLAGLQVELTYDDTALTASQIAHTLDTNVSTAVSNVDGNVVKFVCVKNDFDSEAGYTSLSNLFTVTFTAKKDIANPAALFDQDDIYYLMGDVNAVRIVASNAVYGADKTKIAEAILDSGFDLVVSKKAGTVIVVPTPDGINAMTKSALENAISSAATVTANGNNIGTGSKVSVTQNNVTEEAEIVVKGDVDGDGIVTVFDAMMAKKGEFGNSTAREFAADVNNDNTNTDNDVTGMLQHVVGSATIG